MVHPIGEGIKRTVAFLQEHPAATIPVGLFFALLFTLIDSLIDWGFFFHRSFLDVAFSPNSAEVWMRSLVVVLFLLFSVQMYFVLNSLQRSRKELADSEERYRQTINASNQGYWRIDGDVRTVAVNDALLHMLEYKRDEFLKLSPYDLVDADNRAILREQMRIREYEDHREYEISFRKKDGGNLPVLVHATAIRDDRGLILGSYAFISDMSDHKRMEQDLREGALRMNNIFQSLDEAVFVIDAERTVKEMNQAAEEMFGHTLEEIRRGSTRILHIDEDHFNQFGEKIQEAFDAGKTANFEFQMRRKNGEIFPSEHTVSLLRDEDETILGIVSVVRDITKRKQMEKELVTLATTDPLTGIANRRTGILFLDNHMRLARRKGNRLAVCFVDIDGLKKANDRYGHHIGDELIRNTGRIIADSLRESDLVCRMGGDEFLLVFPDTTVEQAMDIWKRIQARVADHNSGTDRPHRIGLSHGYAEYDPNGNITSDDLITMADMKMYREKKGNK